MQCKFDNEEISSSKIIYRDLGFGTDPGIPLFTVEICVPKQEFTEKFSVPYNAFIDQCQIDDSEGDVLIPELRNIGYPSIDSIFSLEPHILSELIVRYMYFDLLESLFGSNPYTAWEIAINSINFVKISDDLVYIFGHAFKLDASEVS